MNFIKLLLVTLSVSVIASCGILKQQDKNDDPIVVFPSPPDTARIQFLTNISTSHDIVAKQSKFNKFILGEEKPETIIKPFGVAIRYGKIYICDLGLKGIEIIDLEKKTFKYFIPQGKNKLMIPVNCYVDEKGYLYIADSGRKEILIFDAKLKFVASLSEAENFRPFDVFVTHEKKLWVVNHEAKKIQVYQNDSTKKKLFSFPEAKPGDEAYLYQPRNIFVTDDKVFVSDFGAYQIKVYSALDGTFIKTIGSQGMHPGQFSRPKGIAVDQDENLYAVDAVFGNIQIFNKESQLLLFFGNQSKGKGYMYMPAAVDIDYNNLIYFEKFVDPAYDLKYLILVTNQFGPYKLSVYGRVELKR